MPDDAPPVPLDPAASAKAGDGGLASRIVRASVLILVAHFLFKILGLVQARIVGNFCDTMTVELFVFAFDSVLFLAFLVGEEAIAPALLPLFMETKEKHGDARAWRLAGTVVGWQLLIGATVTALLVAFPEWPVRWLTQWDDDPAYLAAAPSYVRWLSVSIVLMTVTTTTYMLLNGYKRFFLAALGEAAVKIGIIGGLVLGLAYAYFALGGREYFGDRLALAALAGGTFAGVVLKLGTHLWGLRREVKWFRLGLSWSDPTFKRFLWLVLPLLGGILFAKARDLYNNVYLLSGLEAGLVKANAWGGKSFKAVGTLVPYAVSIALLPYFCEMIDRDRKDELARTIDTSSRLLFLFFLPAAALLAVVSLPFTMVLFGGGKFSFEDCRQASLSNAFYVWVLPFYALEFVFMRAFFSQRRTWAVVAIGIVASASMMLINTIGIYALGFGGTAALALIAGSYTVTRAGKVVWLGWRLRRSTECFAAGQTVAFLLRVAGVTLATGLAAWAARYGYELWFPLDTALAPAEAANTVTAAGGGWTHKLWNMGRAVGIPLGDLAVAGTAGVSAALASAWFLARAECRLALNYILDRLRRRRGKSVA